MVKAKKNKSKFDDNSTSIFKDTLDVITNNESTFMSMTDKCFDAVNNLTLEDF